MPVYTYQCQTCGKLSDIVRSVSARKDNAFCEVCESVALRVPELFVGKVFEAYYDEGLGADIHSETDRRLIMAEQGAVEAGDRIRGGRNFDDKAPNVIGKSGVTGAPKKINFARIEQNQQMEQNVRTAQNDSADVAFEKAYQKGKSDADQGRFKDTFRALKNGSDKAKKSLDSSITLDGGIGHE